MTPLLLAFDTETSGLPDWNQPSDAPQQPHIVQLAAVLIDPATRQHVQAIDLIIKPDGWVIPDEVAAIHGITTEHAARVGVPERTALDIFMAMHAVAGLRVAHNESFDMRILRIALKRFRDPDDADKWKAAPAECTAKLATPHCQLPPTDKMRAVGRTHFKTPTLGEAYQYFVGEEFIGAHSAMTDVLGCITVYWAIQDLQKAAA